MVQNRLKNELILEPFVHQNALLQAIDSYKDISYFFLLGGYGCGKSFTGVLTILKMYDMFKGHDVTVGIGGTSQTLLRLTLLSDLFRQLNLAHIKYHHNKQEHVITIGTVKFVYINCSNPDDIFAYNFTAFIFDELDELPQQTALAAFTAVQERSRVLCPDGRKAIFVGLTTAQGLKGCFQIVNMLREKGEKYVLVRGLTKNNTTLDPDYVKRLYNLYSPEEREAFLEGKFVNLTTGRVYKDFDERTCTYDPADVVYDNEPVAVGQDLNSGFSKAAAIYEKNGIYYIYKEFSFSIVGDAPAELRRTFPMSQIDWWPDASSKEIMTGYQREISDANIVLHQSPVNPSVNERIMIVNKMFKTGKLFVSRECKELVLALKTRQFDMNGKPEKGKGPKDPDHICDAMEYGVWNIAHIKSLKEALNSLFN